MKQIILDLKQGETILEIVPIPTFKLGQLPIETRLKSTEEMLVDFGNDNYF